VYLILPIALTVLIMTWLLLRRFTLIWIERPISIGESTLAGIAAWIFLFSFITWFIGMVLTTVEYISLHAAQDIWMVIAAALITGVGAVFFFRSRSALGIDDTLDYFKEAIQFRRSGQTRLDLVSLIKLRQKKRTSPVSEYDPAALQRERLQANLSKEKELERQLALLREGTTVDLSEVWRTQTKLHSPHPFCEKVQESRIEPSRKRLSLIINFSELMEEQLKDDMTVLRFNRQIYDFLQSLNSEHWLKPYAPFYESYFLICRAIRVNNENKEVFYPFMKTGVLVSELRKLEGFYFNPRKLAEIATVAFNHGAQV
jgi:hypothetical protein